MKKVLLGALTMAMASLYSCGGSTGDEPLSPDLVQNSATASSVKKEMKMAAITFEVTEHNFGSIVQGESIKKVYNFTNTGDLDLIISAAKGSCGCTVPQWPKRPVKPGQSDKIEVVFNSSNKEGMQNKKVYITANTDPVTNVLVLKGDVVAPN